MPKTTSRRTSVWILVGVCLLQASWVLALPPFRGADEVDHVFRASAVANGEWVSTPSSATIGTGAMVSVDSKLVRAARPACERLAYKAPGDCGPAAVDGPRVEVPTASGRYNPVYYAVVGGPGALFEGSASVLVMRIVSAGLCLAMLAFALLRLDRWGGPRHQAAVVLAVTPTMVYSTTVVAPNGLEMVAALGFWIALLSLARDPEPSHARGHTWLALASGVLLVTLRSMGPFWALAILALALVAWPDLLPRLRALARTGLGRATIAVGLAAGGASLAWIAVQRSLVVGREPSGEAVSLVFRLARSAQEIPVWIFQAIAAFPYRNQPAPLVVYPCFLLLVGLLLVMGLRAGSSRLRMSIALTLAVFVLVPLAITVATLGIFGTAWQGRYALPVLLGVAVMAGDAWARASRGRGVGMLILSLLITLYGLVHVPGVVAVAAEMWRTGAWTGGLGETWHAPVWVVILVVTLGVLATTWALAREAWLGARDSSPGIS